VPVPVLPGTIHPLPPLLCYSSPMEAKKPAATGNHARGQHKSSLPSRSSAVSSTKSSPSSSKPAASSSNTAQPKATASGTKWYTQMKAQAQASSTRRPAAPSAVVAASKPATISPFMKNLLTKHRTAVYWHPACTLHCIPEHPEQPKRIERIIESIRTNCDSSITYREASLAPIEITKLFHTELMVNKFETLWQATYDSYVKDPSSDLVYQKLDSGDTTIMHATKEAALRAVGSVMDAIDHMFLPKEDTQSIDSAFCCIRPPGHHAERDRSMGFCFFNNVGIGAKYLQSKYGVKKIAVLDWDVHHGNGK
jgi:hypothetical protein